MQRLDVQRGCQGVGLGQVGDGDKGIISQFKGNPRLLKLDGQGIVPIEIELLPKRTPGRHAQIAQVQRRVNEVNVVMQTLALAQFEIGFTRAFVGPGPIGLTPFHDPEAMHQVLLDQSFGVGTNGSPQRFGTLGVVENPNILIVRLFRHPLGLA